MGWAILGLVGAMLIGGGLLALLLRLEARLNGPYHEDMEDQGGRSW